MTETRTNLFLDPENQAKFDDDGFVTLPLLGTTEVDDLLGAIATLQPADGFNPAPADNALPTYHFSFLDPSKAYRRQVLDLVERHFASAIARHLPDYRILTANLSIKPPGTGEIPPHQNWPVLADPSDVSVTVWCPLVDADVENGTLHLVPGSQKLVRHIEGPATPSYFADFEEAVPSYYKALPMPAGHCAIFDDSVIHGSPANQSERPRVAVQITCIPKDRQPLFFRRDGDQAFELIAADSDFYCSHDIQELMGPLPSLDRHGRVESPNHKMREADFAAQLKRRTRGRGSSQPRSKFVSTLLRVLAGRH